MMKRGHKKPQQSNPQMALVKYNSSERGVVPIVTEKPKEKAESRRKRILTKSNTPMSAQTFVVSHLAILVISLLFLGGLYFVLNKDSYQDSFVANYLPVTVKPTTFNLEISSPEDEYLTFNKSVVISGSTFAKASVLIVAEGGSAQYSGVEADSEGKFQKAITLTPGLNMIEISSFDINGESKTVKRTVYYSEESL